MPVGVCLSADFNYIDPGDYYYINRFGSNNDKVVVVRKLEYPDVKVRDVDTGESKVVSASKLLTKSELNNEEMANGVLGGLAALAVVGCIANPEACKENTQNANRLDNSGSSENAGFSVKVHNKCDESVRVAIHYKNIDGSWLTKFWWEIDPQENTYLSSGGERVKTNNSVLYYYAYADIGAWRGDATFQEINGESYGMRKIEDTEGDTEIVLSCE